MAHTVKIGKRSLVASPLTLGQLKELHADLERAKDFRPTAAPEVIDSMARILHASLSRENPKLTLQEVEDAVDTETFLPIWRVIMGISGLEPESGEELPGKTSP